MNLIPILVKAITTQKCVKLFINSVKLFIRKAMKCWDVNTFKHIHTHTLLLKIEYYPYIH